ncbi:MAG TPA: DUF1540 domain-containing protein [Tichowtungia sp.]|nr:DUF1540 domain-containing protein [Tichowtungia sp.]
MKKNVKMTEVLNCSQQECAYNQSSKCHALGITVGGGGKEHLCDTLIVADEHTSREETSGVGACKASGCVYNEDWECSADSIDVGIIGGQTECMTFKPSS